MGKNRILKKLNERKGASLAMGLFLFIISITIGVSILTMATTSVGRLSEMEKKREPYYNSLSLLRQVNAEVSGLTLDYDADADNSAQFNSSQLDLLKQSVSKGYAHIFSNESDYTEELTITFSSSSSEVKTCIMNCTFTLYKNNFEIRLDIDSIEMDETEYEVQELSGITFTPENINYHTGDHRDFTIKYGGGEMS